MNNQLVDLQIRISELVERDPYLSGDQTLQNFDWSGPAGQLTSAKKEHGEPCLFAIQEYLRLLSPRMQFPVFHLAGAGGTGKSHIIHGMARWIALNIPNTNPIQHVYWPAYEKNLLEKRSTPINWQAPVLVIEDLDYKPSISEAGSTWVLEEFLTRVKPRVETYQLPTLIVTRRRGQALVNYLASNSRLEVIKPAVDLASDVALLIAGFSQAQGRTYGPDFRLAAAEKPDFIRKVRQQAAKQDMADLGFIVLSKIPELPILW